MDFRPTEEQDLLRRTVREFAESEIGPHVMAWDEAQKFSDDLLPKLAAIGLAGVQFPEEYGGAALSAVDYCICIEELARVCPAVALSVAAHNGLCSAHISMFGSSEQKARFLPRLVRGEVWGAWGLTEAGAGSDAAGMRTTAARQGDSWVLNGAKTFITHGRIGGVMVVIAVTDRTKGHRGISAFIVEHGTTGMSAGKKENKLGMRASDTSEVIFDHCRVPSDQLLGEEGQGFINTLQVLDGGRIGIAALVGRPGTGRVRSGPQLRQGTPAVRAAHRRVPGHPMEARGQRHAHRGRAPADVSGGVSARPRRPHHPRVVHGEAVCQRSGGPGRRRLRPDSRRVRLREGLSGGEVFPRRQAADDRRRHERNPAARDRAADPRTVIEVSLV